MAKISNWTLVSTIESEIQREQNDLKYVDENLMRLTGRDFNEPPRGDRRIRVVSGTKEDEPQPKPRYPKGVFARLGAPVLEGTIKPPRARRVREVSEDDGEPPKKKPLIASSVARPTFDGKTRTEAAAELTKDRASRDRNRRMFGSLLGTLQRFKTEEAKLKDKDDKRAKVEQKLEEKGRAEKELLRQERVDLINQRKERQARIHRLNIKMTRVKEHESWEKYQRQLQKFIRTKSTPRIFWFPKVTNARCLHLISATKENIEKELENERLTLKKELEELLGERFQGDVVDDELEEEYAEGLRREPNESFRGGMGESHFSNGSSLNNFETEEGELINDEGEPWLSGKKGQNSERFVIKVDSMNEAPMRRVEIVTVAAPNARRVKEERVDKDIRVRERILMESERENLMNGKQIETDSVVRKASFKANDDDKEKNLLKEKERKKHEKARNKEREKLRSVVKDPSQQRVVLEGTRNDNLNSDDEKSFPEKKIESPIQSEVNKLDVEKHSKKSKGKNESKENKELTKKYSQKSGKDRNVSENDVAPLVEIIEDNIVSQKSKSLSGVEKNIGKKDYKQASESKDVEDKEGGVLQSVVVDSNDQEKRKTSNDGNTVEKVKIPSQTDNVPSKDRRQSLKDSDESHEEDRKAIKEKVIAQNKSQLPIDGKDTAGRERRLSQKEDLDNPEKKRHQRSHKDAAAKEKKQSHKEGRPLKESRNSTDKDKSHSQRGEKDRNKSEKFKNHTTNEGFEKEKKPASKVSKADREDHGNGKSKREDKGKVRKSKTAKEGIGNEDMDDEEIWSEDLSHISLPLEPEPAVTEVVVQRVPISEDEEDDQNEMQVESMMIPVSQIKKDKTVWEPVPFHKPIVIKKEKDPSPVTDKKAEKESERKKRASVSSSESSDSEDSSSDSEESSEDPSSSNSSDSSSESDGGRTEKKKKADNKDKRLETKKERMGKENGRRNAKRKEESSSSSSEDESSSSSSSESEDSSSEDEKVGKKVKDNKKLTSKDAHKVKTIHGKERSSREKEKARKSDKALPLDTREEIKKKMDEEAERLRQRIIKSVQRRSKSRDRNRSEMRSREKLIEKSKERKKARK